MMFSLTLKRRLQICLGCSLLWIGNLVGDELNEVKLARKARLDVKGTTDGGELRALRLIRGTGYVTRMNWIPAAEQAKSMTAELDVSPLGWRPFELQFTPEKDGEVLLQLKGVWEKGTNEKTVRQEVLWDAVTCSGASLPNGSFEMATPDGELADWESKSGGLLTATEQAPAVDGNHYVKTWHDQFVALPLKVKANQPVNLKGSVRAAFPANYPEMKRIAERDTPAHKAATRFLRGVNFGNFLEVPPQQTWSVRHTATDIQQVAKEGFDHVRLPIGWHHYTGPAPEFRLESSVFKQVDSLLSEARQVGLAVLINIHHFDEFTSKPQEERGRFVAIWRQIAEHYASAPATVAFELLNEPKDAATTEVLNDIYADAIREIRQSNPTRTVFIGPGLWNSAEELLDLRLPDDDWNLIATVHTYEPMYFTHQGTSWTGRDFAIGGIRFPGPPDTPVRIPPRGDFKPYVIEWMDQYSRLPLAENPSSARAFKGTVERCKEWSDYFGRPVHIGEFGAYRKADAASRANYYRAVRERLEKDRIGWAIWDWKAEFRYWNSGAGSPEPGLREALFGERRD